MVDWNDDLVALQQIGAWCKSTTVAMWKSARMAVVLSGLSFTLLLFLHIFATPPVPDLPKARVNFAHATDATTGQPVTRSEWIERALNQPT